MNSGDKGKLLAILYLVLALTTVGFIWYFSRYINVLWIGAIWFLVHQFYVMPRYHKMYYKFNEVQGGAAVRFIPLFNETSVFSPMLSYSTMVLGLAIWLLLGVASLPMIGIDTVTQLVTSIMGDSAGMNYTFYLIFIAIVLYFLLCVIRGLAFIEMKRAVDSEHQRLFGKPSYVPWEGLQYLMFFFPFFRTFGISSLTERLYKMVELNDMHSLSNVEFVEEG